MRADVLVVSGDSVGFDRGGGGYDGRQLPFDTRRQQMHQCYGWVLKLALQLQPISIYAIYLAPIGR